LHRSYPTLHVTAAKCITSNNALHNRTQGDSVAEKDPASPALGDDDALMEDVGKITIDGEVSSYARV
jgi:hypothetical protein